MSTDTHETITDIIAWLRRPIEGENAYLTLWRNEIADRLDAALKRELAATTENSSAVGNAAKLRKACEALVSEIGGYSADGLEVIWCGVSGETIKKVRAALAAPPRNCDTPYNDRVEMYGAFKDWCNAKGHTMEPKLAYDAFEWLLAPATEQEGGNDGNE